MNKYLELAKKIALNNGRLMVEESTKLRGFVKTDKYFNEIVEEKILEQTDILIKENYPDHRFFNVSHEKSISKEGWEWICDPIDGAFAYSRGMNISVTSAALTFNGKAMLAVVYDPWNDKLFHAIKSEGAYLNGNKISVNKSPVERQSFIDTEWWPKAYYDVELMMHELSKQTQVYSMHIGSVIQAACLVAEGVLCAAVFGGLVHGKNHEAASVKLIVEEAGGKFTDLFGKDTGYIGDIHGFIISNPIIHADLVKTSKDFFVNESSK